MFCYDVSITLLSGNKIVHTCNVLECGRMYIVLCDADYDVIACYHLSGVSSVEITGQRLIKD